MLKTIVLCVFGVWLAGCGGRKDAAASEDLFTRDREQKAVTAVEKTARERGRALARMKLEVKEDRDGGHFLVFFFPVSKDGKTFDAPHALFAIVDAKTDQVLRYSDPLAEEARAVRK